MKTPSSIKILENLAKETEPKNKLLKEIAQKKFKTIKE
jgi:hypothetical protein